MRAIGQISCTSHATSQMIFPQTLLHMGQLGRRSWCHFRLRPARPAPPKQPAVKRTPNTHTSTSSGSLSPEQSHCRSSSYGHADGLPLPLSLPAPEQVEPSVETRRVGDKHAAPELQLQQSRASNAPVDIRVARSNGSHGEASKASTGRRVLDLDWDSFEDEPGASAGTAEQQSSDADAPATQAQRGGAWLGATGAETVARAETAASKAGVRGRAGKPVGEGTYKQSYNTSLPALQKCISQNYRSPDASPRADAAEAPPTQRTPRSEAADQANGQAGQQNVRIEEPGGLRRSTFFSRSHSIPRHQRTGRGGSVSPVSIYTVAARRPPPPQRTPEYYQQRRSTAAQARQRPLQLPPLGADAQARAASPLRTRSSSDSGALRGDLPAARSAMPPVAALPQTLGQQSLKLSAETSNSSVAASDKGQARRQSMRWSYNAAFAASRPPPGSSETAASGATPSDDQQNASTAPGSSSSQRRPSARVPSSVWVRA